MSTARGARYVAVPSGHVLTLQAKRRKVRLVAATGDDARMTQSRPKQRRKTTSAASKSSAVSIQAEVAKLPPGRHPDFDVEAAVHDMPTSFVQCRDFNHAWRPFTAEWSTEARAYEVQVRCSRCKTIRRRFIGGHGELLGNAYDYVEGYLIKGMGRLTGEDRDSLRLESVLRIINESGATARAV